MRALVLGLAAWALAGCGPTRPLAEASGTTPTAPAEPALTPSAAPAARVPEPPRPSNPSPERPRGFFRLKVPDFQDAVVSFPETAPLPAPLMIVTHGAGNTPDSMCEVFRAVVGDRAVLLCPAGPRIAAGNEGRYYPDHFALEKIVFAAVAALAAAYPQSADVERAVYSGYSQGATMGALMIFAHGKDCPLLALVEGGVEGWTLARARKFHDEGGRRVLFACGTPHCQKHAQAVSELLRRVGVEVNVVADVHAGHTYGGTVARALSGSFDWLVKDDERFRRKD